MKFVYCFYIQVLFWIEDRLWKVQGSTNLNAAELKHLSSELNPTECINLLETIYSKSPPNNIAGYQQRHNAIVKMTETNCQLKLKEWSRKKNNEAREIVSKTLLDLGRSNLANYTKRDKLDMLSNFSRFENVQMNEKKYVPMIHVAKRSDFSTKIKDEKIKTEQENDQSTLDDVELYTTVYHETMETPQSIDYSVPMTGTDDKIAQMMFEKRNEFAIKNMALDKSEEMSSIRWIAFIIFLLFIILTMFMTAMITIYKNREKHGCDRGTNVKRECDDYCPLMSYSATSQDIEQGWCSSLTDSTTPKSQKNISISSLQWPTIMRIHDTNKKTKKPKKSKIIMKDRQEQKHKVVKKRISKIMKEKVNKVNTKKRRQYETESERNPDEMVLKKTIINLRENNHDCKCSDYDEGKNNEITADEDHCKEYKIYNFTESRSQELVHTNIEETSRMEEEIEKIKKEKQSSLNGMERIRLKSPRLSFPMACTNKDCNTGRLSIQSKDIRLHRS